ncbi:hypothetical protein [Lysobacter terrae]
MTTPVLLDTPPSFAELQQQVKEGVRVGALLLDLAMLAPQLAPKLENLLSLAKIQLGALKAEIGDTEIRVRGTWKLASTTFGVEACFAYAGSGIDCTVAIAPTRNLLTAVGGDLALILKALPIKPADFWITLSTVERRSARIAIEGHEVADAVIAEGRGYLMRFEGRLLELAQLEKVVLSLTDGLEQPVFHVNLNKKISIKPLLDLQLDGLTFANAQQLTITGAATLHLFGATLACAGDLALSARSIGFSADVDPIVKMLDHVFFHAFTLQKSRATITGTLDAYVVGLAGEFKISGSPDGGRYQAQYSSGNTTPFPDLFELDAGRITPSDALTVMTGVPIQLPNALDRLVVLESVYLYYAAFDGRPTLSGVPSRRGAALHGDIVLLGYRGYVAAEAFEDSYRLALLLNPINLGIIEIGGSGEATPATYKGTKVKPGAIRLELDTKKKQAAGDIKIRFLQQAVVTQRATLGEHGLEFAYVISLPQPLGNREYACALEHERVRMTTGLDIEVGISDFGVHIPRLASVQGSISIDAGKSGATATVSATIQLGPLSLPLSLTISAADLAKLPQAIEGEVENKVAEALGKALNWLRVALEGLLKSGTREIQRGLMKIGDELSHRFEGLSAKDAARALKDAGYAMEQALWVLAKNPLEDLMSTFGAAGAYTVDEIVGGLSKLCNQAKPEYLAREIGGLLSTGGLVGEPLARVVMGLSKDIKKAAEALGQIGRSAEEVAAFLIGTKTPVAEAATILGGAFLQIEKETLKNAMKAAGYAEREITKFLDKLWDEGGKLVTNLRNEVKRAWDRYAPSIKL